MIFWKKKKRVPQLHALLADLFGGCDREYDRQVAALDLGAYDEPIAEQALIHIAQRIDEEEDLLKCCGNSIGDIWSRNRRFDEEAAAILTKAAQRGLAEELMGDFPTEIRKLNL